MIFENRLLMTLTIFGKNIAKEIKFRISPKKSRSNRLVDTIIIDFAIQFKCLGVT